MNQSPLYISHHGIKGQSWGVRNGPPYPLKGGDYTETEWRALKKARRNKYSKYNKKHYDEVIKEGTILRTLARDPTRTKNADMFYASHTKADKDRYNAMFNHKTKNPLYDKDGNIVGEGKTYKWLISNKAAKDIKIASRDAGAKTVFDLYKNNRDFYNFVRDPKRLEHFLNSMFVPKKGKYRNVLRKLQDENYIPTDKDLLTLYDTINFVIPNNSKDVVTQRDKLFKNLKSQGYGAVLDINDAVNHPLPAQSPVIVFDMESIIPDSVRKTTMLEVNKSKVLNAGRVALGLT